jgi:hypothetical protein
LKYQGEDIGYEKMRDPKTGQIFEMPLEDKTGTPTIPQ